MSFPPDPQDMLIVADAEAPEGHNTPSWVMQTGKADIFLTYCTNAALTKREAPDQRIVSVPTKLSVGTNPGLTVLEGAAAPSSLLPASGGRR